MILFKIYFTNFTFILPNPKNPKADNSVLHPKTINYKTTVENCFPHGSGGQLKPNNGHGKPVTRWIIFYIL